MGTKKYFLCLFMVIFGVSLASIAFAEEEAVKPHCDFTWTFYSKYIWRGFELSKDSLVIFPSITIGYKGFDMNVWGDFDTDYEGANTGNNDTEWWETDWVFTYSNSFNLLGDTPLNWTLGWIYYDVDSGEDEEVFAIFGLDTSLAPELSVWRGIEWGDSWYIKVAMSHSWDISKYWPEVKGWTFDVGGWLSYYDIDNADYSDFHDADIWAGITIPVNDWCSLSPSINYSFPMSSDAENFIEAASFDGGDSDFVYGGVTLNISF